MGILEMHQNDTMIRDTPLTPSTPHPARRPKRAATTNRRPIAVGQRQYQKNDLDRPERAHVVTNTTTPALGG